MDGNFKKLNRYFDVMNDELIIISTGELKDIAIIEIEYIERISFPCNQMELFEKINICFEKCYSMIPKLPTESPALPKMLNKKSYKQATKNKKLIPLTWEKDKGYIVYPTVKDKRGGYEYVFEASISLGNLLVAEELYLATQKGIEQSVIIN